MSDRSSTSARPVPPVDELSDIAWARVERRLWTELDRAPVAARRAPVRRRWPWLAAAAMAAAMVAVVAAVAWPTSSPRHHESVSRVATGAAPTEVSFGDAAITLAPSSAVLMQGQADRGVAIVLERGSATFAVAPRAGRPPFTVLAGAVQVRVIGTRFTVSRSGDDARVDVAHGEVEVVAWGRREVLLAGASWSSDGVREAAVGRSAPVANPDAAAAAHFSPPAPAAPVDRAPPTGPEPSPVRPPPPAPSPIDPAAPTGPGRDGSPALAPSAADPAAPVASSRARFEAATALEVRDPAAALRAYRALAAGTDAWAANALYAAARLSFARGDRDLAARFAGAYLRRFPAGANAADARTLLARTTGASP
jgi:hypothetical protein